MTPLFSRIALYNIQEDVIVEGMLRITEFELEFHCKEFKNTEDLKKIKFKGTGDCVHEGYVLLGSI